MDVLGYVRYSRRTCLYRGLFIKRISEKLSDKNVEISEITQVDDEYDYCTVQCDYGTIGLLLKVENGILESIFVKPDSIPSDQKNNYIIYMGKIKCAVDDILTVYDGLTVFMNSEDNMTEKNDIVYFIYR